jgi:exodeoxyribonuclease V alpha subunit
LSEHYTDKSDEIFIGSGQVIPRPTGLRLGDIVIATSNNWQKNIMNGSLGRIRRLAAQGEVDEAIENSQPIPVISVSFDTEDELLDEEDVDTLQWGYAITCHKAQGSQFRRVIVPVVAKTLLDRTWIYTALTRATEQVVFVGDEEIIKHAVNENPLISNRTTGLPHHLKTLWQMHQ